MTRVSLIRLYGRSVRMHLLSGMEYKGWWITVLQVLAVAFADVVSTFLLFARFGSIGEWTAERIVLVYGLAATGFGLAKLVCRGFDTFPWRMIRSGSFDRLLLRPRPLPFQVACAAFDLHRASQVFTGALLMGWALSRLAVPLVAWRVLMLLCALAGGILLYSAIFILTSGVSFFSVNTPQWSFILTNASTLVTRCPVPYLPSLLRHFFTFLVPMLLICYYPASALCGWGEPTWTGWLSLPAGLLFLLGSLIVWRVGVRHYRSTGS